MKLKKLRVATPSSSARMIALRADPACPGHDARPCSRGRPAGRPRGSGRGTAPTRETTPRRSRARTGRAAPARARRRCSCPRGTRTRGCRGSASWRRRSPRARRSSGRSRRRRRRRRLRARRCRTRRRRAAPRSGGRARRPPEPSRSGGRGTTSATSITCRRPPRRSTQLPAWSEKIRFGTSATVVSAPICPADACSASTAVGAARSA